MFPPYSPILNENVREDSQTLCVIVLCMCECLFFFFFNTLFTSKSGSCSAILGSNDVYLHSEKFPPFC